MSVVYYESIKRELKIRCMSVGAKDDFSFFAFFSLFFFLPAHASKIRTSGFRVEVWLPHAEEWLGRNIDSQKSKQEFLLIRNNVSWETEYSHASGGHVCSTCKTRLQRSRNPECFWRFSRRPSCAPRRSCGHFNSPMSTHEHAAVHSNAVRFLTTRSKLLFCFREAVHDDVCVLFRERKGTRSRHHRWGFTGQQ